MLREFYVKNYCGLELPEPIILKRVNVFWGECSSGKTLLCRAIVDICDQNDYCNFLSKKDSVFRYCFESDLGKINLRYCKTWQGDLISCYVFSENYNLEFDIPVKGKRLKKQMICFGRNNDNIQMKNVVNELIFEIGNIKSAIYNRKEEQTITGELDRNRFSKMYMNSRWSYKTIYVYDDDYATMCQDKILLKTNACIVTVRHPMDIEILCTNVNQCYILEKKRVIPAELFIDKDLNSVHKLAMWLEKYNKTSMP